MALILIVDDEQIVRQLLTRMLQGRGHDLLEADSAEAALKVMETQQAGVVFSDVQMPGHDGLWLTAEVRKRYPTTAVILATGVSTIAPSVSMQSGVLAYIVKPFSRQAVIDALAEGLAWHEATVANGPAPADTLDKLQHWLDSLE